MPVRWEFSAAAASAAASVAPVGAAASCAACGNGAAFSAPDFAVPGLEAVFAVEGADFFACPFAFGFVGGAAAAVVVVLLVRGGLFTTSAFSCVLLAEAAVGRIMRSRKLPSAGGAAVFLLTWEDLLSGR